MKGHKNVCVNASDQRSHLYDTLKCDAHFFLLNYARNNEEVERKPKKFCDIKEKAGRLNW